MKIETHYTACVVFGNSEGFNYTTNMPSDDVWKNRREFKTDKEAAQAIAAWLIRGRKP